VNRERYIELNSTGQDLTPEEWNRGWHWCVEWDGLLVGPNTEEALVCSCDHPVIEAWKKSEEGKRLQKELDDRSAAYWDSRLAKKPHGDTPEEALRYFEELKGDTE
jgi:hypothetical protein